MPTDTTVQETVTTVSSFFTKLKALPLVSMLEIVLTIVVGLLLIHYATKFTARTLKKSAAIDASLAHLITKITKWVCIFILFTMIADKLGVPMTSFITILGAVGLALSLALQDSLKNFAGGIFIIIAKPFKTGDFIEAGGTSGTVRRIDFIHTILQTVDNKLIYVPNGTLSADRIINYSAEANRRLDLTIPVPYECSTEKAKAIISAVAQDDRRVQQSPEPFVRVWDLSSSSVDIMVRVWCAGDDYFELRSHLLETIKLELDKNGISIPYNKLDVNVITGK